MFCLLCKKHNTANLKSSKVHNLIPAQRLKTDVLKDQSKSAQHAAAVQAEMLSRMSIFHKEVEEQVKSLQNAFMSVYWLAKEMANEKFLSLLTFLQMLGQT